MTEEDELDAIYVCICGYTATGWRIVDHVKERHPNIYKHTCERIGIQEK